MDYPGKVITKTQVTPTQTSASGNWTLDDQAAAIKNNNWPVALVPNPISKSLRFNSADSAYLNRTPASASNRRTWTWSGWVKRSALGSQTFLFNADNGSANSVAIDFFNEQLRIYFVGGTYQVATTQVFRDSSAWYHFVFLVDTTQATSSNRVKIYVNGSQVTDLSTASYPTQNLDTAVNNTVAHNLGFNGVSNYFNGYLTEVNFVDGQALTPSSFGMTNPQTGQWIPLKYSGTYGTNGFYLNFKDATSTTTLGYDYSGNANNWTTNNFSVTAGAGNDSLTDVPTPWFAYNTTGDVGGVIRGNYCTLNPLTIRGATGTLSNGNLSVAASSSSSPADTSMYGTITIPSNGLIYIEALYTVTAGSGNDTRIGVSTVGDTGAYVQAGSTTGYWSYDYKNGTANAQGSNTSYTAASTGQTVMFAIDVANGKIWAGANGTWYNSGNPVAGTGAVLTGVSTSAINLQTTLNGWVNRCSLDFNFGQRPFAYTPPTGFRSLCTTNLPATAIGFGPTNQGNNYFDATLYTGTGSAQSITNSGSMQPDFVWLKRRSSGNSYGLFDSIRGVNNYLSSETTGAEATIANSMTAFNSNGFSLGTDSTWNLNTSTNVAWQWKASGSTVTNTAGTITSTVSANTTAGFSIATYTGNGTNGSTIGHGLGVAPSWVIVKRRGASAGNWTVYSSALGATKYLYLNADSAEGTASVFWNNTAPTSTLVTLGNDGYVNANTGTYVAYCFAAVAGYSAFGSYAGNGSANGTFVYTGFRPEFVMIKTTNFAGYYWNIHDAARNPYNSSNLVLYPNVSNAEDVYSAGSGLDILSNGFKLRDAGGGLNGSGFNYIYMAFAESPFQFANAR